VLIKDNHLAALRGQGMGIPEAVQMARQHAPHTLRVEVEVENVIEGTTRRGASGLFTMVAVDENWHPSPVQPWQPVTEAELEKWREVEKRRTGA